MMYKLIFGVLFASSHLIFARPTFDSLKNKDNYIINAKSYNKGIYKTFEEFKFNNPSIDNYTFDGRHLWHTDPRTNKLKKIRKKEIWGFSDGSRIYRSWRKYDEILVKGRYCYFKEKGTRVMFAINSVPPMILPIPVPYKDELIINFNTGNTYLLSKRLLKKILATDDKELLNEYKNQRRKGKKMFDYIVKYNDRNVSKIK